MILVLGRLVLSGNFRKFDKRIELLLKDEQLDKIRLVQRTSKKKLSRPDVIRLAIDKL